VRSALGEKAVVKILVSDARLGGSGEKERFSVGLSVLVQMTGHW